MNSINNQTSILSLFLMIYMVSGASGQDWKKIVPLQTTCKEVKTILNVDDCKAPVSHYKFSDLSITLNVSDGKGRLKFPKGTVTRVSVGLRNLPPLKDLTKYLDVNIKDFEVFPDGDLPNSRIYVNKKRGISITVQRIWSSSDEEYVTDVDLFPADKTARGLPAGGSRLSESRE